MKNLSLIKVLENLPQEAEIAIEVVKCGSGRQLACSYDIDFEISSDEEITLKIAIER